MIDRYGLTLDVSFAHCHRRHKSGLYDPTPTRWFDPYRPFSATEPAPKETVRAAAADIQEGLFTSRGPDSTERRRERLASLFKQTCAYGALKPDRGLPALALGAEITSGQADDSCPVGRA